MSNKTDFRIVFMGTPDFAVASLKALVENDFNIVGVITSPDKPAGRGQKINQSAVKKYAVEQNLNILQPSNLKNEDFQQELKALRVDLQIIVAFRMLPEAVWSMPRLGSINLHASLLPHYRGAAPINWAVINGENETGVTTFFLKHEIDTGDILFQEKVSIDKEDNAGTIHDKLMVTGAHLLVKTAESIIAKNYSEIPQASLIENELKHAPKIFKPDCKVNWSNEGQKTQNLIRGLSPYPAAWSELVDESGKTSSFKIYNTSFIPANHNNTIGTVLASKDAFKIACKDGYIDIIELQLAGKKRMKTIDFLRGFNQLEKYKAI